MAKKAVKAKKRPVSSARRKVGHKFRKGVTRIYGLMQIVTPANAKIIGSAIAELAMLQKKGRVTKSQLIRIANAPVKDRTLAGMLRNFGQKKVTISELLEKIERAYKTQVPEKVVEKVLNCPKGKFFENVYRAALEHSAPKSFITAMARKRMKGNGSSQEEIKAFAKLEKKLHQISHQRTEAMTIGKKGKVTNLRNQEREIERQIIEDFVKKL